MLQALRATSLRIRREVVEEGLPALVRLKRQSDIRRFRGKLNWKGDLAPMRSGY